MKAASAVALASHGFRAQRLAVNALAIGCLLTNSSVGQPSTVAEAGVSTATESPSAPPLATTAPTASAVAPGGALPPAVPVTAAASPTTGTCTEHLPEGKTRPEVRETFPGRGTSGHHAVLEVEIAHGLGERVLPGAMQVQTQSDAAKVIEAQGFVFPDAGGPGRPRVRRQETPTGVTTRVQITLVPLPKEPGRHELRLPPLPIAMARASGDVITLCTQPHAIVIDDPTANEPNARPKPNPEPSRQREFWVALRNAVYGGAIALLVAALVYLATRWWRRRPKQLPPPPPPRPPWEIALEAFHDIRAAKLIEQQRLQDHFDRVTHTLREYLGNRFGFDGLESTTVEILEHLDDRADASQVFQDVKEFLHEADLVRFADVAPTEAQCHGVLERSEQVVRRSMPEPPRDGATPLGVDAAEPPHASDPNGGPS
jgi:hypothetical protein